MRNQFRLKDARLERELTQAQVAALMGVHTRTYRRYENMEQKVPWWHEGKAIDFIKGDI